MNWQQVPFYERIYIQAGQNFRAIYDMARDNNVTFVSGADPSVGASGGWVMVSRTKILSGY